MLCFLFLFQGLNQLGFFLVHLFGLLLVEIIVSSNLMPSRPSKDQMHWFYYTYHIVVLNLS